MRRFTSRKFIVFAVATVLMLLKCITPEVWLTVALFYMGVEGVSDIVRSAKG